MAGIVCVLAAATLAGLAMVAWLAGILAQILTLVAAAAVVILAPALALLGWRRLDPYWRRTVSGPMVPRLLAGPSAATWEWTGGPGGC